MGGRTVRLYPILKLYTPEEMEKIYSSQTHEAEVTSKDTSMVPPEIQLSLTKHVGSHQDPSYDISSSSRNIEDPKLSTPIAETILQANMSDKIFDGTNASPSTSAKRSISFDGDTSGKPTLEVNPATTPTDTTVTTEAGWKI